ncbi:10777_t:CDS:1, partial [Funneliformis geosporum]
KVSDNNLYGVLPYVAPEVLRGKTYTKAADIYSFGMILYEIITELPPFNDMPYNEVLAMKICQGLRPKFIDIKLPPFISQLIDRCLDADPLKRPTADELNDLFETCDPFNIEYRKQCEEAEEYNRSLHKS